MPGRQPPEGRLSGGNRRSRAAGAPAGRRRGKTRRDLRDTSHAGPSLGESLAALLEAMGGTPERAGLQRLWDNWETALGAELAALAMPLGQRAGRSPARAGEREGATLLLGAEDAMLLQELRFRGDEILARVNAFLGQPYFGAVQVSLPLGKSAPERSRQDPADASALREPGEAAPAPSGVFLRAMDPDSPVARCYARFARRPDGEAAAPSAPPAADGQGRSRPERG